MGILFKGSDVMTKLRRVDTILFDKTGTLTYGDPRVVRSINYDGDRKLAEDLLVSVERSRATHSPRPSSVPTHPRGRSPLTPPR